MQVQWRGYFPPSAEEQKPVVDMTLAAKNGGLIDQRKAVEAVAQIFGIENISAYLETLEKERTQNDQRELDKTTAETEALHSIAAGMSGQNPAGKRTAGGANAPKAAGGGNGGSKAPPPPKK